MRNPQSIFRNLPEVQTDRMVLRKMRPSDAEAIFAYASDPEVSRYVIWDTHRSIQDSRAFLDLILAGYEADGEPN